MKRILLSCLIMISSVMLIAQWSTDPLTNNVICSLGGEQAIPKIAVGPSGDSYIAYFSNESGNYNIRLQRVDQLGNILWATNGLLISNNTSDTWLTDWDMTCDQTNHAILVWQDIRNGNNNVYAYRIAPDGTFVWGANGIALSNNSAFNVSPKVTVTAANNAVFAWQSDDVVIIQKVNPAGALQWGANGITLSSANRYSWPQLLPVSTDDVILKLFDDSGPVNSPTRHVLARRFGPDGSAVWSNFTTVSNAGGISAWTQIFPFINDGNDGFYIAWHDDRDNNMRASVYVQHVNSAGQIQFVANGVEASTASSQNHYYPTLAKPPGSDDIFVYWNELNANQSQWGITGQKLNTSGTRQWGNTGLICIPVTTTQVSPIDAQHSPDDMVVFYHEYATVLNSAIKAMRIATDGSFVWAPPHAFVSSLQSEKGKAVVTTFHNNQWVLGWEDSRTGNRDIYAQNIQLNADLGPYNPEYGYIEGNVVLNGGNGNVTQVLITAGSYSTNPDPTGFYSFEVQTGTYTVNASLTGYYPESTTDVIVLNDQTTGNVNFTLNPIPTHGFIEGNVTLIGGEGDLTLTEVRAGNSVTYPDETGYYTMELAVGAWSVEASLAGYYTSVLDNVIVEPGLTTSDVDFDLIPLPPMGYIEGQVSLLGGPGNVTEVVVSNGTSVTNPDQTGFYSLESETGIYTVSASLNGYITQFNEEVTVVDGQTTSGVDFELPLSPTSGFIEGQISLEGGTADITLTSVKAGLNMTYADEDGYYLLATSPGTHSVEASNPYTDTQVIEEVVVIAGETTPDIDFILNITHADLIAFAYDSDNNILNQVLLTITGPDSTYSGLIEDDSLVFYHVPFGDYQGNASYFDHLTSSSAVIDSENSLMRFIFTTVNTKSLPKYQSGKMSCPPLSAQAPNFRYACVISTFSFGHSNSEGISMAQGRLFRVL
jgi:hypothetical protein